MNTLCNNRGFTLVFVAMGLLTFLLFLGLALDTGWLVYVRAQGQARIDSSALAAAAALTEPISAGERRTRAEALANVFSEKNSVVNSTVNPENVVTPMTYNETTGTLTEALSWDLWGGSNPICNAVRVTTDVPTPVFFAGIRNVFGAQETGQENLTVSAVSHLPCPGIITRNEDNKLLPLAIARAFLNFPNGCNLFHPLGAVNAALARVTSLPLPVQVGTSITLEPLPTDLAALQDLLLDQVNLPICDNVAIVPVVEDVSSGSQLIKGFAAICMDPGGGGGVSVQLKLQCGEVAPSSAGTGECFGTYASNPILIR